MSSADGAARLSTEPLARALRVDAVDLERVLAEVGVDVDYLAGTVYDGDPQDVLTDVSHRLHVQKADVVVGVVKALVDAGRVDAGRVPDLLDAAFEAVQDAPVVRARVQLARASRSESSEPDPAPREVTIAPMAPPEQAPRTPESDALAALLADRLPRLVRRARVGAAAVGAACVAFGAVGFLWPAAFQAAARYLAAAGFVAAGAILLGAAWRLARTRRALDRFAADVKRAG